MKISMFLLTLLFQLSLMAQSDSCSTRKSYSNSFTFHVESDTSVYAGRDSLSDDTSKYSRRQKHADDRLIFFVHGLGGAANSWSPADVGLTNEYVYVPHRPDYYISQNHWLSSAYDLQADMLQGINAYNSTRKDHYVIAHSMGGVLSRQLNLYYYENDGQTKRPHPGFDRAFYGLVTFGSPHAGAPIIANQEDVIAIFESGCDALVNAGVVDVITDLYLKYPIIMWLVSEDVIRTVYQFSNSICNHLLAQVSPYLLDDFTVPTAADITPGSAVLDRMSTFSDPKLPKVAFYGKEHDPLIWRTLHNLLVQSPSAYPVFGADDDAGLPAAMEESAVNYLAHQLAAEQKVQQLKGLQQQYKTYALAFPIFYAMANNLGYQSRQYQRKADAFEDAVEWFASANTKWKWAIGALDQNSTRQEILGYKCYCEGTWLELFTPYTTRDWNDCQNYVNAQCMRGKPTIEPIYRQVYLEQPSDGVVPMSSAVAFPGVHPDNVKLMDGSNHQQMRNDANTEIALRMVFDGLTGEFFKLDRK